mmetsp:Transcript_39983/g.79078  ORF Transcript_39983/g.79078 Transcript_39983/m.79078 type:complete len:514 (+) Transcript_39983:78-1619(+)|eukprot:CAMPEP_0172677916 /NCGR_PEP_ID=MMETSP1074-20121228/15007_1 /TAXON_ID=2916 /ORGANISM="Ceratium fusus, Strain PA161109" /LENGTH=513 /DNA_ID=CAMNT_0013495835 /DNA_START=75 /DNA_END=1616 /DNA_ORIENTATION=-
MITRVVSLSDGRLLCCITVFLFLVTETDVPLRRHCNAAGCLEGSKRFNLPVVANGPCQADNFHSRRNLNALIDGLSADSCSWPSWQQRSSSMLQRTRTALPKIGHNGEASPVEEDNTKPDPHLGRLRPVAAHNSLPMQLSTTGHRAWIKQDARLGMLEVALVNSSQLAERWSKTVKHAWSHRSEVWLSVLEHLRRKTFGSSFALVFVALLLLIGIVATVVACMEVRCQWTEFRNSITENRTSTDRLPNDHTIPDRRNTKSRICGSGSKPSRGSAQPFLTPSLISGQNSPLLPFGHHPTGSWSPQSEQCNPELFGPCLCPELVVPQGNECKLEVPRLAANSSEHKGRILVRDLSDKPVFKVDFDLTAAPLRGRTRVDRLIVSCAKRNKIFAVCQESTEDSANELAINHPGGTLFGKIRANGSTRADGFSLATQVDAREVHFSALPNSAGLEATDEHGQLLSVTVPLDDQALRSTRIGPFVDAGLAVASILAVEVLELQLMHGSVRSSVQSHKLA